MASDLHLPRFITGQGTRLGLAGYLQTNIRGWGTATVASGDTSIVVADADILVGDIVLASVITKGANACYVVGTALVAGTSFEIDVNTDPGSGGAVIGFIVLRPTP